jgi:2-amino-4-hydroxy-6-hydroxymethyldihydropteridine diphosphokinase
MRYYLGLGGNIGDTKSYFKKALEMIAQKGLGGVVLKSSLYETEPLGGPEQRWYLNAAVAVESSLSPEKMMGGLREVETELGREKTRPVPDAPRVIDLDILLADDIIMDTPELTIPHARMTGRRFVLEPLSEIAPETVHPVKKKRVCDLLLESGDRAQVKKTGERF